MKTCELICNMESGKGIKRQELNAIIKILKDYDYKTNLYLTEKHGDAKRYVKKLKGKPFNYMYAEPNIGYHINQEHYMK